MKRWQLRSESLGCRRSRLTFEQGHNVRRCQREFAGVHSGGVEEGGHGPVDKPRWRQPQCLRDRCRQLLRGTVIVRVKRRLVVGKRHQTSLLDFDYGLLRTRRSGVRIPQCTISYPPADSGYVSISTGKRNEQLVASRPCATYFLRYCVFS